MSKESESLSNLRNRAGRYVSQPTGYRAFVPAPLPPDSPIRYYGHWEEWLALFLRRVAYVSREGTGYKRNRVFRYTPYIEIFSDNAPDGSNESKGDPS